MKERLLTMLLAFCMLATTVPMAFAANESPIPTEYLPKVQGFNYDANDGTASIRYTMKKYDDGDKYTTGYRALIWGNNGNRNNVFSGYLIEDDDAGTTAGDQKLWQELGMNFFDEPAAGYTPILSSVVAFLSPDPLYTEQTGYGVNVTLEDGIHIPTGVEDFSGSGPIYGTTLGTGFEKGMYYLQIRHDGGVWFTATGSVSGPDDTLYVDGTTAGDISWAGRTPSIYNAPEVYFWRSTCTGVSSDGKTINFEVTRMQSGAATPTPEEPTPTPEEPTPTPEEPASEVPFRDVRTSDWFYDAVKYVYDNEMMSGTGSDRFGPDETTTRGMIVTILYRMENEPSAAASDFTDVSADMYYADAVNWAAENEIVNGTDATTFSPNLPITREQLAAILYRYAQFKDYNTSVGGMSLSEYADAAQISSYATTAMQWANAEGLISGDTATTINPTGNATRAEVATILMRFVENIA